MGEEQVEKNVYDERKADALEMVKTWKEEESVTADFVAERSPNPTDKDNPPEEDDARKPETIPVENEIKPAAESPSSKYVEYFINKAVELGYDRETAAELEKSGHLVKVLSIAEKRMSVDDKPAREEKPAPKELPDFSLKADDLGMDDEVIVKLNSTFKNIVDYFSKQNDENNKKLEYYIGEVNQRKAEDFISGFEKSVANLGDEWKQKFSTPAAMETLKMHADLVRASHELRGIKPPSGDELIKLAAIAYDPAYAVKVEAMKIEKKYRSAENRITGKPTSKSVSQMVSPTDSERASRKTVSEIWNEAKEAGIV